MEQGPWMRKWVAKIDTATLVEYISLDGDPWLTLSDAIFKIFTKDCAVIMCIHDVHIVCSAQRDIWMMHWELFLKKGLSICKLLRLWEREGKKKYGLIFFKKKSQLIKQYSFCELKLMPHYPHTLGHNHIHSHAHNHTHTHMNNHVHWCSLIIFILWFTFQIQGALSSNSKALLFHAAPLASERGLRKLSPRTNPRPKMFSLWLTGCVCMCVCNVCV